jgi:cyanophycin synthetase
MNPGRLGQRTTSNKVGTAVVEQGINGDMITIYDTGSTQIFVAGLHLTFPATIEGKAVHNVQNAMFASAMAFAMDGFRTNSPWFYAPLIPPPGTWSDELGYDEHPFKV